MDELKKLLGDLFDQVAAKLGKKQVFLYDEGQKVIVDDGQLIPKYRMDEVIEKSRLLKEQADNFEKDLKILKKAAEGNEGLTQKITDLQEANKKAKQDADVHVARMGKQLAIKEHLMNAGVTNADARDLLATKFDPDKVEIADGKIKGFDEMLAPVKANKAFSAMFGQVMIAGQQHATGDDPHVELGEYASKNPFSRAALNIAEQVRLTREKPDLAKRLREIAVE